MLAYITWTQPLGRRECTRIMPYAHAANRVVLLRKQRSFGFTLVLVQE